MPQKSRNFEGCWTCRTRKVKCDLAKPVCNRCVKAKFKCEGYDIKLGWSDPLTIDSRNELITIRIQDGLSLDNGSINNEFQRRKITAVPFPKLLAYTTFKEVEDAIERVDFWIVRNSKNVLDGKQYKFGPFSVFRSPSLVQAQDSVQTEDWSNGLGMNPKNGQPLSQPQDKVVKLKHSLQKRKNILDFSDSYGEQQDSPSIFSKTINNSWVHFELLDYAKLTILAIKGINYNFDEQNMLHILYPKFFPNIDSDDWKANVLVLNKLFKYTPSDGITVFPLFNKLLKCFKNNVSCFLRINYDKNFWQKAIIPFIYKTFGEFLYLDINKGEDNKSDSDNDEEENEKESWSMEEKIDHIKSSIVYSVLCIAAFQQHFENQEYLTLSIELRKLTITIINSHLDKYGDDEVIVPHKEETDGTNCDSNFDLEYEELLLLGIILQLQIDSYFSVFENYDYLYGIGEFLIKEKFFKQNIKNVLNMSLYLIGLFNYYQTFYESTQSINMANYSMDENDLKRVYRDIGEDYNLIQDRSGNKSGSESGSDSDSDSDSESDGNGEVMKRVETTKNNHKKVLMKPIISNLISSNDDNLSFSINFQGKRSDEEPKRKKRKTTSSLPILTKSSLINTDSSIVYPYVPDPNKMGYNTFNSELIYVLFGIPKSLIDIFYKVIQLTNHKKVFLQKKVFPRNFPVICADIEDALLSWDESKYWTLFNDKHQFILNFHQAVYHNIKSFHHSLIVYFYQLVKQLETLSFQNHIHMTLDHLKELISLNKVSRGDGESEGEQVQFRPSFWQILVCAADALDPKIRSQYQKIWLSDEFSEKGNYWRAKQIIYEVWKRRDVGEDVTWMDMVREWDVVMSLG